MTTLLVVVVALLAIYLLYRLLRASRRAGPFVLLENLDVEGDFQKVPLPPLCEPGEEVAKIKVYFTRATMPQLRDYLHRTLPAAGWTLHDQLATAFFFHRRKRRLTVVIQTMGLLDSRTKVSMTMSKF